MHEFTATHLHHHFWWVFPLVMILFCLLMARGCRRRRLADGTRRRWRRFGPCGWYQEPESARDILDKRFAKGEIDAKEYGEKRSKLETDESPTTG